VETVIAEKTRRPFRTESNRSKTGGEDRGKPEKCHSPSPRKSRRAPGIRALALALLAGALLGWGCGDADPPAPPSILLVVVDTLRADAVSAYGNGLETTPAFDALAEEGRLYIRAYAPSPWTLPSHASLLTGQTVEDHGVGLAGRVVLPKAARTLAERLRDRGYETAAFSENALISEDFGFAQGFDHFAVRTAEEQMAAGKKGTIDVVDELRDWLQGRDPQRPFFVFVNLYDPHEPYELRDVNPFLPPGTTTADAEHLKAGGRTSHLICDRIPGENPLQVLRGLYLGDVASADRKLGRIRDLLESPGVTNLVTVVTSDHGEHFGEHRLLDHEFSVHEEVLRIPLVVHGPSLEAGPIQAARLDEPVELRDVAHSLLEWAGADSSGLTGQKLQTESASDSPRDLIALYSDNRMRLPPAFDRTTAREVQDFKRQGCGEADRVFGDMLALTRYPFRVNWYARYPSEFVDLRPRKDPSQVLPPPPSELFASLQAEAELFAARARLGENVAPEPLPPESEEALRSLGYID